MEEEKGMVPVEEGKGLVPKDFEGLWRMAKMVAASGMDVAKPEQIMIKFQKGYELGLTPMQSLEYICVINNKPRVFGDLPLALVRKSGLLTSIEETSKGEGDSFEATCIVYRKGEDKPTARTWGIAKSRRAGLLGKDNWKAYPERMCQMRARAWALRDAFGDILVAMPRHVADADDETEPKVVTGQVVDSKIGELEAAVKKPEIKKLEDPLPPQEEWTGKVTVGDAAPNFTVAEPADTVADYEVMRKTQQYQEYDPVTEEPMARYALYKKLRIMDLLDFYKVEYNPNWTGNQLHMLLLEEWKRRTAQPEAPDEPEPKEAMEPETTPEEDEERLKKAEELRKLKAEVLAYWRDPNTSMYVEQAAQKLKCAVHPQSMEQAVQMLDLIVEWRQADEQGF